MPRESKTSVRRLKAKEKQRIALNLRIEGKTFVEIAKELGYAHSSGAFKAVESALDATLREPAEHLRELELQRLDKMWDKMFWQLKDGNHKVINALLRISERRSKLLGLDQPVKIAPTDPTGEFEYTGIADSEVVQEFLEVLERQRKEAGDSSSS